MFSQNDESYIIEGNKEGLIQNDDQKQEEEDSKFEEKNERCNFMQQCLKSVSVGQYQTKLYSKGKISYSSSLGGISTLFIGCLILVFAIFVFADIL